MRVFDGCCCANPITPLLPRTCGRCSTRRDGSTPSLVIHFDAFRRMVGSDATTNNARKAAMMRPGGGRFESEVGEVPGVCA